MPESPLAQKLKLKPGQRAAAIDAPKPILEALTPLPEGAQLFTVLDGQFDWVLAFAKNKADLAAMAPLVRAALRPLSLLWIAFPKGSSKMQADLTRDKGWEPLEGMDLKWINLVSIDEDWSAFSLRPYREGEQRQSFR